MGHKLHIHLGMLVPDIRGKERMRQNLQKHSHGLHAKDKQFQENDPVMAKNFSLGLTLTKSGCQSLRLIIILKGLFQVD